MAPGPPKNCNHQLGHVGRVIDRQRVDADALGEILHGPPLKRDLGLVALGVPTTANLNLPVVAVEATANKFRFRTVLANSGLLTPPFSLLTVDVDPERAAREAIYPCVLKPLMLSASRGVIRADNSDQFITAFHRITRILEQPDVVTMGDTAKHILVEEYVAGREVALEGLLDGNYALEKVHFLKPHNYSPLRGAALEKKDTRGPA